MQAGQIHLTLMFLGDVESTRIEAIRSALSEPLHGVLPIGLELGGNGAFPSLERPRVLWAGVRMPDGDLVLLHGRIEQAMAGLGFAREDRAFSPHLTLGRVREDAGSVYLRAIREAIGDTARETPQAFSVTKVTLFRSQLKPEGAVYSVLAEFPLGAEA